jgi:carbon-monoxide dehydrogenase large subunit
VRAVYTGADVAHLARSEPSRWVPGLELFPRSPIAVGDVACIGRSVAAVVADSAAAARDALDLLEVEYEPREPVVDARAAVLPGAPLVQPLLGVPNHLFTHRVGEGDLEAIRTVATREIRATVTMARVAPTALETRAGLVDWHAERLTVWSSNQAVYRVRDGLADRFRLPSDDIRVIAPDVGGAFGGKAGLFDEDVVLAHAAMSLGAPVKWTAGRIEDLATTGHGRGQSIDLVGYFDDEARLRGLEATVVCDLGAYPEDGTTISPVRSLVMLPGPYRVEAARLSVLGVLTNLPTTGAYRGAGRPDATLAIEHLMNVASREFGLDPVEVRRRNLVRADEFPWRSAAGKTYDSGDYLGALDKLLETGAYDAGARSSASVVTNRHRIGVGLSVYVEPSGGGGESARVGVTAHGEVEVRLGSTAHGQGHVTTFARLAARLLMVDEASVTVLQGDTSLLPTGTGTFASRTAAIAGSAVRQGCQAIIEQGRQAAANLLEAAVSDIEFEMGRFVVLGATQRTVSWAELATSAGPFSADSFFSQDEGYGFGAYIAIVRIDSESGLIRLERILGVDDCGVVLEPRLVEGQAHGSLAQALGQVLKEQVVPDESGALATGSMLDYAVPRASDMPWMEQQHTVTPSPLNPLGVKGAGESGTVGAPPAIAAAVLDALGQSGCPVLRLPFTSETAWSLLR